MTEEEFAALPVSVQRVLDTMLDDVNDWIDVANALSVAARMALEGHDEAQDALRDALAMYVMRAWADCPVPTYIDDVLDDDSFVV